jgi:hypothetical protein
VRPDLPQPTHGLGRGYGINHYSLIDEERVKDKSDKMYI